MRFVNQKNSAPANIAMVDSGGDHRIAMAFAVAALRAEGDTLVLGADAAAISFPEFFAMLEHVAER